MNCAAVDASLAELHEIAVPARADATRMRPPVVPVEAPDFVQNVTALMLAGRGDRLPVSAFPPYGTWPSGTTRWERRNVALEIPVWDHDLCIQCNKCALVCPHAAVRVKCYPNEAVAGAPEAFKHVKYRAKEWKDHSYTVQVAPEDCTGCTLCVEVCPARDKSNPRHKALSMAPQPPLRDQERESFDFFLNLPELPREEVARNVKQTQFLEPLFEFSGACSGCGETPYVKLLTQLYGDRLLVANATGCSSIYGGNLPTTPYAQNRDGRGPAWSNSLFEDNAEFGLGMRMAVDQQAGEARRLLRELAGKLGDSCVQGLLDADQSEEAGVIAQRARVAELKKRLPSLGSGDAQRLLELADCLVERSVWIVGGDGWAYDIGYGGVDHVLASGKNVNVLVLDTEVYSNTGGQQSKATPLGAAAKFAADGKERPKKDLGLLAMAYGDVYVASVAFGAKDTQTVRAFVEAESYPGASLIIAYSHCIAHGYDLSNALEQQKLAVKTGYWPLYRYDPRQAEQGVFPLHLDSAAPKAPLEDFIYNEARCRMLQQASPERAAKLLGLAQQHVDRRYGLYEQLAARGQKG